MDKPNFSVELTNSDGTAERIFTEITDSECLLRFSGENGTGIIQKIQTSDAPSLNSTELRSVLTTVIDQKLKSEYVLTSANTELELHGGDLVTQFVDSRVIADLHYRNFCSGPIFKSKDYLSQVIPNPAREIVILYNLAGTRFISVSNPDGSPIMIPYNIVNTISTLGHGFAGAPARVRAFISDDYLFVVDLMFYKQDITNYSLRTRFELLNRIIKKPIQKLVTIQPSEDKIEALQRCIATDSTLYLEPNDKLYSDGMSPALSYVVKTGGTVILQVQGITTQGVSLFGRISGLPIVLGEAPIPPNFTIDMLDTVLVRFSGIVDNELANLEILCLLQDCEASINHSLARQLGYVISRPALKAVK